MNGDFTLYTPTKVVFGHKAEEKVGELICAFGGSRVLIHYGGGSVVRSGLLDRVKASLEKAGLFYVELGGVVPNPQLAKVYEGIELAKVKVIEIVPQKRSLVTPLNEELIEEARFLRSAMETAVVSLVCERRTEEDLRAFEENVKLQSFCLANGMSEKIMQLDDEFHRAFYEIAHKMEIYRLMQNMAIHFDRVRNMALYSVSEIKIVQDHEAILKAIREQNGEMAGSLLKKHLNRYRIDAGAIKERFPEFF